jgi:membrane-bound hydrogenase subunit beta
VEQTNKVADRLKEILGEEVIEIKSPRKRRIFLRLKKESFREVIQRIMNDLKITHLSTITGVDLGQEIELLYHFAYRGSIELTVGYRITKENPSVRTLTDIVPGAVLYEREVHEILGVNFEGHPSLLPLILPETWPVGVYPLRKDQKFEELRKIGYGS